jgi:hypothetical protein
MFLLEFVNRVRRAQACEPLQVLEIGYLPALEQAMQCRLDERAMRFGNPEVAREVAVEAGLPLGHTVGTVELPPAIRGYVEHCVIG